MAEPEKEPMPTEAFRAKKASGTDNARKSSLPSKVSSTRVSSENLSARDVGIDQRQEKVRMLREKQADERKKKNEERRAAFEERKRQRESDEKTKWEAMKEQLLKQGSAPPKTGTGRKLPSIPTERPSTAGPTRLSSIPRLSRPATAMVAPTKNASRGSPGSSSADSSPASTPSSKMRSSLGGAKSVSASNLSTAGPRRASSSSVGPRQRSSSKPRQSTSANKPTSGQNSLAPGKLLSKAQSTSAIHTIGNSRKGSTSGIHKIGQSSAKKAESKPKAGMMDEAAAKQALAERRRQAREEAERVAMLDKQRQEEERLKREEEERIRAEEEAKEEARMRELAELLRQQEEERLKQAMEEKEKRDKEEAEKLAAEAKQREEERLAREEEEKRAREEAERKAREDEERRKQEEVERQERRRRVEQIMSRTRQTAHVAATDDTKPTLQVPPNNSQETKNLDTGDTKQKMNEILQKVKGLSGSQTNLSQIGDDEETIDHSVGSINEITDKLDDKDQCGSALSDRGSESDIAMPPDCDNSNKSSEQGRSHSSGSAESGLNGERSHCMNSKDEVNGSACVVSNGESLAEGENLSGNMWNNTQENLTGGVTETQGQNDVGLCLDDSGSTESTPNKPSLAVGMDNASVAVVGDSVDGAAAVDTMGPELLAQNGEDEETLWVKAEHIMRAREAQVIEALENSGIVAEGDEDDESEEAYMWKVIEGKIEIAEAV